MLMKYTSILLCSLAAFGILPSPVSSTCEDTVGDFDWNGKTKDCGFAITKPEKCDVGLSDICPASCGLCDNECQDTVGDFEWNEKTKDCSFAKEKPFKCSEGNLSDFCPASCGVCDSEPSPSDKPSSAPSPSPPSSAACEDTVGDFDWNGKTKDCGFAITKPEKCDVGLSDICPASCGLCGNECQDTVGDFEWNGKTKDCSFAKEKPFKCSEGNLSDFCPASCGVCDGEPSPSDKPSSAPSPSPSSSTTCEDTVGEFDWNGKTKDCGFAITKPEKCDVGLSDICPASCGLCEEECVDSEETFTISSGKIKDCSFAADKPFKCKDESALTDNCPFSCGLCTPTSSPSVTPTEYPTKAPTMSPTMIPTDTPTMSPTMVPTDSPTLSPSMKPTDSPTASPTNIPTDSPTMSPTDIPTLSPSTSMAPTEKQCILKTVLEFPQIDKLEYYGYSNDYLTIEKEGEEDICGWFYTQNTEWGCTHEGDAYISNNQDPVYNDKRESENSIITEAFGSNYIVYVDHYFSENELYYDEDHKIQSRLKIYINDEKIANFKSPKNVGVDTHLDDGSINPAYEGNYAVDVQCDNDCVCTADKVVEPEPQCSITAVLSFPEVDETTYYGYHNAIMSATKSGEDTGCGYTHDTYYTSWGCFHTGDAYIWKLDDDLYDSEGDEESITIEDGTGGSFNFLVEHYPSGWDTYYEMEDVAPATMTISSGIGGLIGSFSSSVVQADIGDNWSFNVALECDMECVCVAVEE